MKILSLLIIIIFTSVFSTVAQEQKFSRTEILQDIDTMISSIKEVHPNMFAVYPKSKFYEDLEGVKALITDSMDIFGVYKIAEPLTALLGDGHTQLNLPREHFKGEEKFFPLSVTVNTNDSTITTNLAYTQGSITIPENAKILSINGIPYKYIIEEMLKFHSGERIFFRLVKTSMNFSDILYILCSSNNFDIKYSYNGKTSKEILNAIPRKNVQNDFLTKLFTPPLFSYVIDKEKEIAILTIKSMAGKDEFQQMAEEMFAELKSQNIDNLIVDLRNNGGGDSRIGDILISYLIDAPFNQFRKAEVKVSRRVKSMGIFPDAIPDTTGIITVGSSSFTFINAKPLQERYTGRVYVLTNHMTFSSASSLAWLLKESGIAKTVGEETGGMCISYGNIIQQQLPISGITLTVSFARMYLTGSDECNIHGVLPDFSVDSTDALDKVLNLIAN